MTDVANGFILEEEDLEDIDQEDLDELEEIIDDYQQLIDDFNGDLDDVLQRINDSEVYKELGVELHIDIEYLYSMGEQ